MKKEQEILVFETFGGTGIGGTVQGEGMRVGVPSIFIRVFGCNFSCGSFGQPKGKAIPIEEMPHNTFDPSKVTSINDLPVFDIGCDSAAAWSKKYRHLAKKYTVDTLLTKLDEYRNKYDYETPDIVITGGEPLLRKYQSFWVEFIRTAQDTYKEITFETNGTQILTDQLFSAIANSTARFTFSVSPKLGISGEPRKKALVPEAVSSYRILTDKFDWKNRGHQLYLKFVIRSEEDMPEVYDFLTEYQNYLSETYPEIKPPIVYLMPEGATIEGLKMTDRRVAEIAIENGMRYSPRLHCALFGNSWGT